MTSTIVDAGPLVAFYNQQDRAHQWSRRQIDAAAQPLLTSETVLTEAAYLIQSGGGNPRPLILSLASGLITVPISVVSEAPHLDRLMRKYQDLPMSLADACVVRLSEIQNNCVVLTLDRHFTFYRRFGRQTIPLVAPWN